MTNKTIGVFILGVLIIGVGVFYGGMRYQSSKDASLAQGNFTARRGAGSVNSANFTGGNGGGRNAGGGAASGEIIAKDDKSITLKLRDGGSKIVFYSASTQLQKMAEAIQSDFAVGKQIMVNGTANSDGSIVAKLIQLRTDNQPSSSPSVGR